MTHAPTVRRGLLQIPLTRRRSGRAQHLLDGLGLAERQLCVANVRPPRAVLSFDRAPARRVWSAGKKLHLVAPTILPAQVR
jgi:hypothetical protein